MTPDGFRQTERHPTDLDRQKDTDRKRDTQTEREGLPDKDRHSDTERERGGILTYRHPVRERRPERDAKRERRPD